MSPFDFDEASQTFFKRDVASDHALDIRAWLAGIAREHGQEAARLKAHIVIAATVRHLLDAEGPGAIETVIEGMRTALAAWRATKQAPEPGQVPS